MPGGSKKGGGLEVGSAYKMKYNKSSFPFKSSDNKKHIGGNLKKKIMSSKLVKDLKEASSIVEDDINKLVGRKTHPGHGNEEKRGKLKRGYPKYDEKGEYIHKYWQK